MTTREIPRNDWRHFYDTFTTRNLGSYVNVEVISPDLGDQMEAEDIPLLAVTADKKDVENLVEIELGPKLDKRVNRAVEDTVHIYLKQREDGTDEALEIESADGIKTLLVFRPSNLPAKREGSPKS